MEVAEGIHRIETPFGDRVNAVYLLVGSRAALLVDTATKDTARRYIGGYVEQLGVSPGDLRYVLNTHSDWDHMAGNGTVRRLFPQAVFACHELDRPMVEDIERMISRRYGEFAEPHGHEETAESMDAVRAGSEAVPIDLGLIGGEVVDLGGWRVTVRHTPGHSWGSVSVHDPRSAAVIVGDAVLGDAVPTATGEPAFPPTYRYVDTYLATIDLLRQLAPTTLLTSHYPVYRDEAVEEFLLGSRAFVERVEHAVRRYLSTAGARATMAQLIAGVNDSLGSWPAAAAPALHFPLSGHLERLVAHGLLDAARNAEGRVEYTWTG